MQRKNNIKIIPTNCSAYLLPMIFKNKSDIPLYKGTFAGDIELPELSHNIFVLCGFDGSMDQKEFEDKFTDNDLFVTLYYPDDVSTMFVYDIPPDLDNNYMKIMQGKYSEIDEKYKKIICSFWNINENNKYHQIMYKSDVRRKQLEEEFNCKIPKDNELGTLFTKETDWFNDSHKERKVLGGFHERR